ncbi:peroxisomal catalase, putative [Eimeria tenella]|uniref:Peroxisomal catalase, putative n=1 Tax=Eimeria tenella TaxID=5802 RepID=U6L000_EIMTE|nr:peroxisomal catalase, putative [Eimeria tenella]CDJ43752.1 peroxisomal catalase, putative [Eimeria tenella]|eukprot:XP_013234501.1 peroxisomal catalase, putative [Eimeria tenella]
MFWDFLSLSPETLHQTTILFSDRGTPDGYRHMHGYSSHAFKLVNSEGVVHYAKFHLKTNQKIKNLSRQRAQQLAGEDPDYATRDLFNAIQSGNFPSWTLYIQVMPVAEAPKYKYNVLDVTKVLPQKDFPLLPVGQLTLTKNPKNYFQEVEQVAFSPGNLIPGIEPSEDKLLQGRLFAYPDTQRHRLGPNFDQIPVNRPRCPLRAIHIRDGPMCVNGNYGALPNYEPNSIPGAPKEAPQFKPSQTPLSGFTGHFPNSHPNDDFEQAGILYRDVMTPEDREALIGNIVDHLKHADRHSAK